MDEQTHHFLLFCRQWLIDTGLKLAHTDDECVLLADGTRIYRDRIAWVDNKYDSGISLVAVRAMRFAEAFCQMKAELAATGIMLVEEAYEGEPRDDTLGSDESADEEDPGLCLPPVRWRIAVGAQKADAYLRSMVGRLEYVGAGHEDERPTVFNTDKAAWTRFATTIRESEFCRITLAHRAELAALTQLFDQLVATLPIGLQCAPDEPLHNRLVTQTQLLMADATLSPGGDDATKVEQHFHELQL